MTSILLVDDEQAFLDGVIMMLKLEGFSNIIAQTDPTQVPKMIETMKFDLALLDITMPSMNGLDLLKIIKEQSPETECIMLTANESIPSIMKATKLGAYDYLIKPIMPEQLTHALNQALERKRLLESLRLRSETYIKKSLNNPKAFEEIITSSLLRLKW